MLSRQIESFITAAEAGSFSKAAKTLFISAPSLIQQIDLLEARLGLTLFERGHRGVSLTPQGESLYNDALHIIQQSNEAVAKAQRIQGGSRSPIRVGTSLLMKCRMLPDIWAKMVDSTRDFKNMRIEIVPLRESTSGVGESLDRIGSEFDLMEGLYLSGLYNNRCNFLELKSVPLRIAFPTREAPKDNHVLESNALQGMSAVTLRRCVSRSFDNMRSVLHDLGIAEIIEVPHYDMGVFADCELNGRLLVIPELWRDLDQGIELFEAPHAPSIPYGLMYAKQPSTETLDFIHFAETLITTDPPQ